MTKRIYPKRYMVYTLKEIINNLYLRDTPHLCINGKEGIDGVIQTSHITDEQLLSVDKIEDTRWVYIRETSEWIPIFHYVGNRHNLPLSHFIDVEKAIPIFHSELDDSFWITPKGFKREQYDGATHDTN